MYKYWMYESENVVIILIAQILNDFTYQHKVADK